jgi:murein DD-endopeptidase MepM/ murein hydrolase activator NlpD
MNSSSGNKSGMRLGAVAVIAALTLAACDAGNIMLWPWVEVGPKDDANAPPPPPPPLSPVDPLDPDSVNPDGAVPNPVANTGAPDGGTPFVEKPEDPKVPVGDSAPPVSAETGEPVPELPPPTETADATPAPSTPTPTTPPPAAKASFYFFRSGNLAPSSGTGSLEAAALVPDMAFPIKSAPAVAQTQVYRYGGGVKGGDQCDARNFSAPWRDNYCEARTTDATTPWCAKTGVHLGQDIRVGTPDGCKAEVKTKAADRSRYEVVAVEDGVISNVGSYSISLRADSGGRIYRYLHLNMAKLKVATGQTVKKGDVVGYVSNDFGGTPTTLHLHFEIRLNTVENGWQYAPPYSSLLEAYKRREDNSGAMVADNFVVAAAPR